MNFIIVFISLLSLVSAIHYEPNWKSIDSRPLPKWYDEAKVGIFIHFGVFSVPSYVDEWFWDWWLLRPNQQIINFMKKHYSPSFTYPEFGPQFTAEWFNANQWAKLFERSGAKYVVLTTKHHEGFTLWPSKFSFTWNSVDIGPKRDIVGELEHAVRAHGLRFGTYHSLMEWFHPLYLKEKGSKWKTDLFVRTKIRPEMEELVNTYKPDIVWSDGDAEAPDTYWNSTDFLAWLYNESPVKDHVVVNDRWGIGTHGKHGGFHNSADRYNPGVIQKHKWESAITIDRHSWGFRREATLTDYLTIDQLLFQLVSAVSCGGNILINVGPRKDGTISPIFQERLTQLGDWLALNGEGIYSSKPWTTCQNDTSTKDIWYTSKPEMNSVYGFVLNWPTTDSIHFGCLKIEQIQSVQLFGSNEIINFNANGNGIDVHMPRWTPDQPIKHCPTFKFIVK
ncbi:hypothetical protein RDWZM_006857 [Blomia tropicalis]|uniref:Putative alpha-L-fucosidase n=1 Tax=Blomia tropicalis TaxID=40697 RepID=A0A9Q0MC73_BLOTA|nr:hypothetical protein RDWZM_006857 [Blomia tropicalis]